MEFASHSFGSLSHQERGSGQVFRVLWSVRLSLRRLQAQRIRLAVLRVDCIVAFEVDAQVVGPNPREKVSSW